MKIVIDIPMKTYKSFMDEWTESTDVLQAVRHGTPLPEHHGRLIDADALVESCVYFETIAELEDAPTIIERSEDDAT